MEGDCVRRALALLEKARPREARGLDGAAPGSKGGAGGRSHGIGVLAAAPPKKGGAGEEAGAGPRAGSNGKGGLGVSGCSRPALGRRGRRDGKGGPRGFFCSWPE
ncbi:hypothetical protein NDU88_002309 [Pleurodeles waltl]|uniref:Uncharacterized protein n=1 Tax=Pleurodeles waltl TaxID=8319 RepID=A0AAV7LJY0_PLEWA|nr:hypothetical protein NDU88_002309 [Pleurodeles waltl]